MDHSENAAKIFGKLAQLYQDKFMDVSLYDNSLDFFCKSITTSSPEILEIACGPGNLTRVLLNKRPDFKILGTDLAPEMVNLARLNNPSAEFKVMEGRHVNSLEKKFMGVICGFFLPYLSKEETIKLIGDISEILLPGGLIYLSTMEDDYAKSGFERGSTGDQIFMHYHQSNYLNTALIQNGLEILSLRRISNPKSDGTPNVDLVIIAAKK